MFGKYLKLYKSAGKYNVQQKYGTILEADMVSTTEEITYNITTDFKTSTNTKNLSARKSLNQIF